jgi:hypothetical protein
VAFAFSSHALYLIPATPRSSAQGRIQSASETGNILVTARSSPIKMEVTIPARGPRHPRPKGAKDEAPFRFQDSGFLTSTICLPKKRN